MVLRTIACDIGGVLLKSRYGADGCTADHTADAEWIPGALEGLRSLTETHTVYLLSFCGRGTEELTRARLRAAGLDAWLPENRWLFCRNRLHKSRIMKQYGIEVLIDDLEEIIMDVKTNGLNGILFENWAQTLALVDAASCGGT